MRCPYCAEEIKDAAAVCKHCHRDLFVARRRLDQNGIAMAQAEIPPGTHVLRIDVKDVEGRATSATITFSVVLK
jgi:hypothetical protein